MSPFDNVPQILCVFKYNPRSFVSHYKITINKLFQSWLQYTYMHTAVNCIRLVLVEFEIVSSRTKRTFSYRKLLILYRSQRRI